MPGAGGTVYGFRTLANELEGECSFYAFEAQGADGRTRPSGSVEEMAAQYIGEMRRISHGPYVLIGYSFGGVVAYEMAAQLAAKGAAPARVVLLDTAVPPTIQPEGFHSSRARGIAGIRGSARGLIAMRVARSLAWARRSFRTPVSPKVYLRYLLGYMNSLSARYTPPNYSGPVDYVQVVYGDHAPTDKHARAWRNVASELRVHQVDIPSHLHLMSEPWVRKLVPVLRGVLEAPAKDGDESEHR